MSAQNPQRIVVVGAGMVGHRFVESLLSREDLPVRVTLVGDEGRLPYDRVGLTGYLTGRDADELTLDPHALADERASEVALGKIVPRTLAPVAMDAAAAETREATARLRHAVVGERRQLTAVLSSWASFLAASADAGQVLEHAANIGERLDLMRDVTLEVDASTTHPAGARAQLERLNLAIEAYNSGVGALIDELDRVIAETNRLESM